ncbi:BRCA1-associated protein [Pelomyxa schiedti]|nr:BRCA1-associated protein [Pelomyxa schiedti]
MFRIVVETDQKTNASALSCDTTDVTASGSVCAPSPDLQSQTGLKTGVVHTPPLVSPSAPTALVGIAAPASGSVTCSSPPLPLPSPPAPEDIAAPSGDDGGGPAAAAFPERVFFNCGNPSVESITGIIHLYKSNPRKEGSPPPSHHAAETHNPQQGVDQPGLPTDPPTQLVGDRQAQPPTQALQAQAVAQTLPQTQQQAVDSNNPQLNIPNSTLLCVLAVPSYLTTSDFARFISGFHRSIHYMKLLRDASPNKYMVLLKFDDQQSTDDFYFAYNGRRFSSLELETCHVLYVAKVEFISPSTAQPLFPPPGLTELPTCPVCLERMDADSTGLLTILCNHTFHTECLAQWKASGCPVCRYAQQPLGYDTKCYSCDCTVSKELWICLLCGHIGCGRFTHSHAFEHFKSTRHAYSLNLETKRVWDYVGDNWVHRIVQNRTDGKLIELDSKDDKMAMNSLEMEYTQLLQNHLAVFEREMTELKLEHRQQMSKMISAHKEQMGSLHKEIAALSGQLSKLEKERKHEAAKAKAAQQKALQLANEKEELIDQNRTLRESNEHHLEKVERLVKDDTKDRKIAALEAELKDLMFHLEAQEQVKNNTELQQGNIVTQAPPSPPTTTTATTTNTSTSSNTNTTTSTSTSRGRGTRRGGRKS